jgi:hypothetical protein
VGRLARHGLPGAPSSFDRPGVYRKRPSRETAPFQDVQRFADIVTFSVTAVNAPS